MGTTFKAPQPFTDAPSPWLFLAGSIEMGAAEDWQVRVERDLAATSVTILNPRRDDWDSSWVQSIHNPQFREQVEWELKGLRLADLILLYLVPGTKSPISLLELGLHVASGRMVVVCPNGFWRKGNVEIVCAGYGVAVYVSLDEGIMELRSRLGV